MMDYTDVVGQEAIVDYFKEAIIKDRFPHALIIQGPPGHGSLPLTLAVATHLLCDLDDKKQPCGKCTSCRQMGKLIHPDCHFAFPVVKKGTKTRKDTTSLDFMTEWREMVSSNPYMSHHEWLQKIATNSARGDINVTECNRIIRELSLKSFGGSRKIQIIWMAEYLGKNANKLLKLIEEPPPGTHLFLIAENLDRIIMTVQSRCQIIRVPRVVEHDMAEYLQRHQGVAVDRAVEIAQISDGDVGRALCYLEIASDEILPVGLRWMDLCKKYDVLGIRDWVDEVDGFNSEEKKVVISALLRFLRAQMHLRYQDDKAMDAETQFKKEIEKRPYIRYLELRQSEQLMKVLQESMTLLDRNAYSKIVLFNTSIRMCRIFDGRFDQLPGSEQVLLLSGHE